jgi:hypothetical protein
VQRRGRLSKKGETLSEPRRPKRLFSIRHHICVPVTPRSKPKQPGFDGLGIVTRPGLLSGEGWPTYQRVDLPVTTIGAVEGQNRRRKRCPCENVARGRVELLCCRADRRTGAGRTRRNKLRGSPRGLYRLQRARARRRRCWWCRWWGSRWCRWRGQRRIRNLSSKVPPPLLSALNSRMPLRALVRHAGQSRIEAAGGSGAPMHTTGPAQSLSCGYRPAMWAAQAARVRPSQARRPPRYKSRQQRCGNGRE